MEGLANTSNPPHNHWAIAQVHDAGELRVLPFLVYGSRLVLNTNKGLIIMFDLNPWAARFARRFPKPALQSGEDKDPKHLFSTKDVTLPHGAVLREWYYGTGFAQSTPGVVTDTMGFTDISHYI